MASFLSRVFRNRSLSRGSSFRNSEPSLNDSSRNASSNSRGTKKFNSSASVSNLGSYELDTRELERNKLHKAAWTGNLKKVQRLARSGQVNLRDSQSRTPIHLAVVKGHVGIVQFLISQGARLDLQDDEGRTPLVKAVLSGVQNPRINFDICKALIDGHAADFINQPDKKGKTALHYAIEHGHENLVYLFLRTGNCDLNLQDRDEMTPLHLSIKRNNARMAEAILSRDHQPQVDPNIVNRYGQTALHTAASMGYDDIVRSLLRSGLDQPCDTTITDSNDLTALDLAKKNHHEISAKLIEEFQEKFGKRMLTRGLSTSTHEAPSLKANSSISMTPRANRDVSDDETSDDSSSMDSQRPAIRQTLKRPSDQWSDDNGSSASRPPMKNVSALVNTNPLASTTVASPTTNSSISALVNVNPLQSNKKTKISQPLSFMGIGPVVERMDSDQTTSRSNSLVPSRNIPTTTKKPVVSTTKSWSDETLSQPVQPLYQTPLKKKQTGDSDTWDSTSAALSDDDETGKYKPTTNVVNLHSTQAFGLPAESSSDDDDGEDSFETEIRRMDTDKPSTNATGPGYKVIGPSDVLSQVSEASTWTTSPVRATSTNKVLQTLVNQNPLLSKKSSESTWDDSRPLSNIEDHSIVKTEPKSSTSIIGKLLVTPLSEPKEEEKSSIASISVPYERPTVRASVSSIHDARVNDLKESIKKLEQNQEDVMKLKSQLREMERKKVEFEDLCRQQERLAREFEQKYQQEKAEKQQFKRTSDDFHFQVEQLNDEVQNLRDDKDRLNRLCLDLKEKRNQSDEKLRQLQMKLLQDEDVSRRPELPPSTVEIPIRSTYNNNNNNNEELQKLTEEKNFYQQEFERIKHEKDQLYQEKTQIKLKYDGLLEEIRMILLDRSKLEQQLTTELQERMEQRQRSKEELHKYQLQITEVNQKLADAQARLVVLQSQTSSVPVPPQRVPSLPNVAQSDENYLVEHGEQIRNETARVKTELDRLRGDFDRIVSTYEPTNSIEQYAQIHSHIDVFRQYYEQEFRQRQALRSKLNTSLPVSSSSTSIWKEQRTEDPDETLRKTLPSLPRNASALLTNNSFRTYRENAHL